MNLVNEKMSNNELQSAIKFFLMEHNQGSLATVLNDIPRSSPVMFFLGEEFNIYLASAGGDKFKAIEQNENVCLLVNTEYLDYRRIKGVQIFGKAKVGSTDDDIYKEAEKFIRDKNIINNEDVRIIKIIPDHIVYLNSTSTGNRTKQILNL